MTSSRSNLRIFVKKALNFKGQLHSKILNQTRFLCQVLTACNISNKSNKRLLRYCFFIFSLSCMIKSWQDYLFMPDNSISQVRIERQSSSKILFLAILTTLNFDRCHGNKSCDINHLETFIKP